MPFKKGNRLWQKANHKGQKCWNKNFTKETHASLKKQSKSLSIHWQKVGHPKGMLGKKHTKETKIKMSLKRKGKLNGNWKGGLTAIKRGLKRTPEYYQWRKAVLERDNKICQECGKLNSKLVHHIKSFKEFPKLRFDINNGITLCLDCHKKIHFGGGVSSNAHV